MREEKDVSTDAMDVKNQEWGESEQSDSVAAVQDLDETTLKERLEKSEDKAANYYDQLLRLRAEFENYRKRTEKEKLESQRFGKIEIINRTLSLLDMFETAEAHIAKSDLASVKTGIEMLINEFKRFLTDEGMEEIQPKLGETFNPEWHEAVATEEKEEEGKVVNIIQKGYRYNGLLLRPARVGVSVLSTGSQNHIEENKETSQKN